MVKLACLPKFASAMFEVVRTGLLVGADGEWWFVGIDGSFDSTTTHDVGWVMIFAGISIFASAGPQVVTAIWLSGALRKK